MDKTISKCAVEGVVEPPSSKSYAQRALAAALLAQGTSQLHNLQFCDDTLGALRCIKALGATVTELSERSISIQGGLNPQSGVLKVGESGLATRLFTPIASLCDKEILVQGESTLHSRPMHMMLTPLRELGARIEDNNGYLPLKVQGPIHGSEIEVDGSLSSQFITGLLLALPLVKSDTTLTVHGAVSTPYIDMTIATAKSFGVEIHHRDYTEFYIPSQQQYLPTDYTIEGDWSSAAFLLVAGAIAGSVTVRNLSPLTKQADRLICKALERAGAEIIFDNNTVTCSHRELHAFEFDARHCPDLLPILSILAANAEGCSTLRGVSRLEHKECNRGEAIVRELTKIGVSVELIDPDTMQIVGGKIGSATVQSYGDHRMAMSLSVAALRSEGGITIEGAECVAKSYPNFFRDLETLMV